MTAQPSPAAERADSTRLFMTHHGPMGGWCSLTFGLPNCGLSIDIERSLVGDSGNLYVGVARGNDDVTVLPFFSGAIRDAEVENLTTGERGGSRWQVISGQQLTRTMGPATDEYRAPQFTFRVLSPLPALSDPAAGATLQYETCPAVLLELEVDNTSHDEPCRAFIGLEAKAFGKPNALDWMTDGRLCGIGYREEWALAALPQEGVVYTVRGDLSRAMDGTALVHSVGQQGGVFRLVPPRSRATLLCAFGFFHHGPATQGVSGHYWYTQHFADVREVCAYALEHADRFRDDCRQFDDEVLGACPDRPRRELFNQSLRSYAANTQLLVGDDGQPLFSVCEGQFRWRNTLDLAADHLPWELRRNAWVVRNIMDLYIDRYTYRDELRFPGDPRWQPGGLAFTHDMGADTCYSPAGQGGYEQANHSGYCFMTTEQVLNGIYCMAAYALAAGDVDWADERRQTLLDLLESLQARDHYDPARRDGLLKGQSSAAGERGHEITTYDCLDASLQSARGNLYIAVKTWCANLLLEALFAQLGDEVAASRARAMAGKTAASLVERFDASRQAFPSNLLEPSDSLMIAAIEPLAVPMFVGLEPALRQFESLVERLRQHVGSCLQPGACVDAATGGLRLVSSSRNTWPSKGFLCAFVAERFFGVDLESQYPTVMREFVHWMQIAAAEKTPTDQMLADTRAAHNGSYYPRMVTSSLWLR